MELRILTPSLFLLIWSLDLVSGKIILEQLSQEEAGGLTICEFYNATCIAENKHDPESRAQCWGNQTCPKTSQHSCYAVWSNANVTQNNKTNSSKETGIRENLEHLEQHHHRSGLKVKLMGCFLSTDDCQRNSDRCTDSSPSPGEDEHLFCCCTGSFCNAGFRWTPQLPQLPPAGGAAAAAEAGLDSEASAVAERKAAGSVILILVAVASLAVVAAVIGAVVFFVRRTRKRAREQAAAAAGGARVAEEFQGGGGGAGGLAPPSPKLLNKEIEVRLLKMNCIWFPGKNNAKKNNAEIFFS